MDLVVVVMPRRPAATSAHFTEPTRATRAATSDGTGIHNVKPAGQKFYNYFGVTSIFFASALDTHPACPETAQVASTFGKTGDLRMTAQWK